MALDYATLHTQAADAGFLGRVEAALIQVIKAPGGPLQHEPAKSNDKTMTAQLDRQARTILASPASWAKAYADLIANQLIGKSSLIDVTVTTDGDLFAAATAVFADLLPPVNV